MRVEFFPITVKGHELAGRLCKGLPDSLVHAPAKLRDGGLKKAVKGAFAGAQALVFIGAVGIAVRVIAPYIRRKDIDPAVVVVDEAGKYCISLLSGHLGGANRLAKELASIAGAEPVITTATDIAKLPCAEDIASFISAEIEDIKAVKAINSAILNNERVHVADANPERLLALKKAFGPCKRFVFSKSARKSTPTVVITSKLFDKMPGALVLRPKEIVVGIGCGKGVGAKEILSAYKSALSEAKISGLSVARIASAEVKRGEAGLERFSRALKLPIDFIDSSVIKAKVVCPSRRSKAAQRTFGIPGVAEPCALISSGAKRLCRAKQKSGRVTIALAKIPYTS